MRIETENDGKYLEMREKKILEIVTEKERDSERGCD